MRSESVSLRIFARCRNVGSGAGVSAVNVTNDINAHGSFRSLKALGSCLNPESTN